MDECQRIVDQLHRAFFAGAWYGPSFKEALSSVEADTAAANLLPGAHSIWELVHHVHAWIAEADATVRGKKYETLRGEKNWPPVTDVSREAWDRILTVLEQAELSLEAAVKSLTVERLGEGERSYYALLHGIIQHSAYHAGQIALLKKAVSRPD